MKGKKGKDNWPKAIFYDSKNTLFAWDTVWIRACSNILQKYGSNVDPEDFWRRWAGFMSGENFKVAFGKYREFTESLQISLADAFRYFGVPGDPRDVKVLTDLWDAVQPYPDTAAALTRQQELTKVFIFSNVETVYLQMMVDKIGGGFRPDFLGDMQKSHCCKPSPRAYRWVLEQVGLEAKDVIYCAGPQWDVQGAMAFGMKGAWVHRPYRTTKEVQGVPYDYEVDDLHGLTRIIESTLLGA